MRAADLGPNGLLGIGALLGLAGGLVGVRLADRLPARYDIELIVGGRARTRRNVALVVTAVAAGGWLGHLVAMAADASIERAAFYFLMNLTLCVAILSAAAVDLEHMVLPNELTLGGALLALATSPWRGVGLLGALIGAGVGLGLMYLPFVLYKRLRGHSGMGLGDAKLALLAGAWLGPEGAIFVVFAGAVQSALCALSMRALGLSFAVPASVQAELQVLKAKAAAGDADAKSMLADDPMAADVGEGGPGRAGEVLTMRLPMGPFLVLACLEFLFARRQLLELFNRYIAPS